MLRTSNIRSIYCTLKQIYRSSSAAPPVLPSEKHRNSDDTSPSTHSFDEIPSTNVHFNSVDKGKSRMVAAVFASLKQNPVVTKKPDKTASIDEKILSCKVPEDLLVLSEKEILSRKQALKIVTTLAEWSVNGLADMATFETDPRFVSLCQLLGRSSSKTPQTSVISRHPNQGKPGDLSVVLEVTAEDEAAKIASTLSLPQMIRVLSTLANQKKRSLPLLRTLAFRIADSNIKLDVKKCADILFALSTLNFPDEVLLGKVTDDLTDVIMTCEKPAVISSICTSIGRLRYRNDRVLDSLCEWIINNKTICRSQELVSILITLAIVHHSPVIGNNFFDVLISELSEDDLPTASTWLDVVWSLVILGKANSQHYKSVLSQRFMQRMLSSQSELTEGSNVAWKKKLLNINGMAKFDPIYAGQTLDENKDIDVIPMVRSKGKQQLVKSVIDALSSILPSAAYLRNNVETGMGFLIDAECRLDGKLTPYPLVDKKTRLPIPHKSGKSQKIAVMCWDYHDSTRGRVVLTGANALNINLLNKSGFRVLSVCYNEYNVKDKLSERVLYIENSLKRTVKPNS